MDIHSYLDKVYCGGALGLLRGMPGQSVHSVINHATYDAAIYRECLRVLRPGGVLAWAQAAESARHFPDWFGDGYRIWTLARLGSRNKTATGHLWVVQTQDRRPVPFPDKDSLVLYDRLGPLKTRHPCMKPVEEMVWLVEALTRPGKIVLDCFCGLGATLLAAQRLGRPFVGCDISRLYCKITLRRLRAAKAELAKPKVGPAKGHEDPKGKDGTATPPWLFDRLDKLARELTGRGFELDAAAEPWNAKCPRYFDEETDALKQDWSAWPTVFCNPPFSARLISAFVGKALEAADKGSTVVLLLPMWPGYEWYQALKRRGQMQDILGPVAFARADGTKVVLNNGRRSMSLVVATVGPKVVAGTNGEPIAK
jgi:phage N-6-adenine-methyltransferase